MTHWERVINCKGQRVSSSESETYRAPIPIHMPRLDCVRITRMNHNTARALLLELPLQVKQVLSQLHCSRSNAGWFDVFVLINFLPDRHEDVQCLRAKQGQSVSSIPALSRHYPGIFPEHRVKQKRCAVPLSSVWHLPFRYSSSLSCTYHKAVGLADSASSGSHKKQR